jgi:hypothetical protein
MTFIRAGRVPATVRFRGHDSTVSVTALGHLRGEDGCGCGVSAGGRDRSGGHGQKGVVPGF